MFSEEMLYIKVVDNLFILLVLKFHGHMSSSLEVMIFSSPISESVQIQYMFRKLDCLAKLKWESVLSDYRRILVLFLSFPTNFGSLFLVIYKLSYSCLNYRVWICPNLDREVCLCKLTLICIELIWDGYKWVVDNFISFLKSLGSPDLDF